MKIICLILLLPASLFAQAVISEVLYNEPGSQTLLEWVEIYNSTDSTIDLTHFLFISEDDTAHLSPDAYVPANSYAILARHLSALDGSASFEGYWGDSSGYWGDHHNENYPAFNARMNLSNASGAIYLLRENGDIVDQCVWSTAAGDGQSLERDGVDPPSGSWHLSTDPDGSTPGRVNSPKETQSDTETLALSTRLISQSKGEALDIDYSVPAGSSITLEIFDDSGRKQIALIDKLSGKGQVSWDGRSSDGKELSPGVYLLLSTISGSETSSKCIPVVIAP